MNDARVTKQWKTVEVQLNMASELLLDPSLFEVAQQEFADYRFSEIIKDRHR